MAFEELDAVSLLDDFPQYGLRRGDIGTIVQAEKGFDTVMVEFVTSDGSTVALEDFRISVLNGRKEGDLAVPRAINKKYLI